MISTKEESKLLSTEIQNEEIREVLKENVLPVEVAKRYLNIYLGQLDNWDHYLGLLWKYSSSNPEKMKQLVCAAMLLPAVDRSTKIDQTHPENLLLKVRSFHQIDQRDWFELFKQTYNRDVEIDVWRMQALSLGVVHPIEYQPISRQAFNWLYEKVEYNNLIHNDEIKKDITSRLTHMIQAYGGAVICNIFTRHAKTLETIVNWRTGYFFERNIFNVYKIDEILKIKKAELQKTNQKLVKSIKVL